MGISQENENGPRTKSRQSPAQTRAQKAHCLTFPKAARIRSRRHYAGVVKSGKKLSGTSVQIDYRLGFSSRPKLGITVSRKFGKAHDRNRFKRVVREAFRETAPKLPADLEINILPRSPILKISKKSVLEDLTLLLSKLCTSSKVHFPI